ncbi:hypothetical protein [Thalassoglobus sp.]|uniref:hypothetical protein n=1 Tax=Thalassoglobus sp. TaxID=2795869 RepID=UPI003AA7E635
MPRRIPQARVLNAAGCQFSLNRPRVQYEPVKTTGLSLEIDSDAGKDYPIQALEAKLEEK